MIGRRVAAVSVLVLALAAGTGRWAAAAPTIGASPNPDNTVSALAAPTPLPHGYMFERLGGGQPPWAGPPVVFSNADTVNVEIRSYFPGNPCDTEPAYLCPPESEVQGFEPGESFLHPTWRVPLGHDESDANALDASAPVWSDGSVVVVTNDSNCTACTPVTPPVLIRLSPDGKVVWQGALTVPKAIASLGSGVDYVDAYPTSGGLLLSEAGLPENGGPTAQAFVLEKVGPKGAVKWSVPGGSVVWYQGKVVLLAAPRGGYEAISAATGKILWASATVEGTTTPDIGVSPPTRNAPDGVEIFSRSPLRVKHFALTGARHNCGDE